MAELAKVDKDNIFYGAGQGLRTTVAPAVRAAGAAAADIYSIVPRTIGTAVQNVYRGATGSEPVEFNALPISRGMRTAPTSALMEPAPTRPTSAATAAQPSTSAGLRSVAAAPAAQQRAVMEPAPLSAETYQEVPTGGQVGSRRAMAPAVAGRGTPSDPAYWNDRIELINGNVSAIKNIRTGAIERLTDVASGAPLAVTGLDERGEPVYSPTGPGTEYATRLAEEGRIGAQTGLAQTQARLLPRETESQIGLRSAQTQNLLAPKAQSPIPLSYEIPNPNDPLGPGLKQQVLFNPATGQVINPLTQQRQRAARQAPKEILDKLLADPTEENKRLFQEYWDLPEGM